MATAQVPHVLYPWHDHAVEAERFLELIRQGFPDVTQSSISKSLLRTLTEGYQMPESEAILWRDRLLKNIHTLMRRGYSLEPYYAYAGNLVLVGMDGLSIRSRQRLISRLHELGNLYTGLTTPGPIPLSVSKTKEYLQAAHTGHRSAPLDEPTVQHDFEARSRKRGREQLRTQIEPDATNNPCVYFCDDELTEYYCHECQTFLTLRRMGYHDVTVESIKDGLLHTLIVKYHMPEYEAKKWQKELSKHITKLMRKQKALDLYAKHKGDLVLVAIEDMASNRRTRLEQRIQHWSRPGSNVCITAGPIPLSLAKTKRYLTIQGSMNRRNDTSRARPTTFLPSHLQSPYRTRPQQPRNDFGFAQDALTRQQRQQRQQRQHAVTRQQAQHEVRARPQERPEGSVPSHSAAQVQSRSNGRYGVATAAVIASPAREVQTSLPVLPHSGQADRRPLSRHVTAANEVQDALSTRRFLNTPSPFRITPPGSPYDLWLRLPDTPLLVDEFDNWTVE